MTSPFLVSTLVTPLTNPSWLSWLNSSNDFNFVSGMRSVENMPVNMKNAKISMLWKELVNLRSISIGNIILSVGGLIPGYYATLLLIDSWGRKPIQLMGFAILTVLYCCMGTFPPCILDPRACHKWHKWCATSGTLPHTALFYSLCSLIIFPFPFPFPFTTATTATTVVIVVIVASIFILILNCRFWIPRLDCNSPNNKSLRSPLLHLKLLSELRSEH